MCELLLHRGSVWATIDLPDRYGKSKSVHKRFTRWGKAGVRERVFEMPSRDHDNEYLMIDSAIVASSRGGRHGPKRGISDQAPGRSRGGLTSKCHIAVDSLGRPIRFLLTGGQANDAANPLPLIAGITARHLIADKAMTPTPPSSTMPSRSAPALSSRSDLA